MKGFANSGSIICSTIIGVYLFDAVITAQFLAGAALVLSSVWIYGMPSSQPKKTLIASNSAKSLVLDDAEQTAMRDKSIV
jgi:hypothetical protein